MDSGDIILTIISTLVGGLFGWLLHGIATREGRKSTGQILASDEATQRLVNTLGHALKDAGFDIPFDAEGNLSRSYKGSISFIGGGEMKLAGTATPQNPPPVYDRQHENKPPEGVDS